MKVAFLLILVLFTFLQGGKCGGKVMENVELKVSPAPNATTKYDRLPENVTLESEVNNNGKTTTVEKKLNELKARYEKEKLIDQKGIEIRFFEPLCRGVSAGFEQDEADRKAKEKELAELEKKYTVIVLLCDPRKVM